LRGRRGEEWGVGSGEWGGIKGGVTGILEGLMCKIVADNTPQHGRSVVPNRCNNSVKIVYQQSNNRVTTE
jgi:hypothetical protein